MVEYMSFNVMDTEYLLHWAAEILAFQESSVWVMPEANPQIPLQMLLLQSFQH